MTIKTYSSSEHGFLLAAPQVAADRPSFAEAVQHIRALLNNGMHTGVREEAYAFVERVRKSPAPVDGGAAPVVRYEMRIRKKHGPGYWGEWSLCSDELAKDPPEDEDWECEVRGLYAAAPVDGGAAGVRALEKQTQHPDDTFRGGTRQLIDCMRALVALDIEGALVPHGIGGHARALLTSAAARLELVMDADRSAGGAAGVRESNEEWLARQAYQDGLVGRPFYPSVSGAEDSQRRAWERGSADRSAGGAAGVPDLIEAMCARIKAADDAAADGDYMLDSDDCIKVLRGTWKGPLAMDYPIAPVDGGAAGVRIPEGWKLVKQSRLDEIARLSADPSVPCYRGRNTYDEDKVHGNWVACKSNLSSIQVASEAIRDGWDDEELQDAARSARAGAPSASGEDAS